MTKYNKAWAAGVAAGAVEFLTTAMPAISAQMGTVIESVLTGAIIAVVAYAIPNKD